MMMKTEMTMKMKMKRRRMMMSILGQNCIAIAYIISSSHRLLIHISDAVAFWVP
jgi:hypothetical protein